MINRRNFLIYNVIMAFVSLLSFCVFTVWWVGYSIDSNNKPMCDVVTVITQPRPQLPIDPQATQAPKNPNEEYEKKLQQYRKDSAEYNRRAAERLTALSQKYKCDRSKQ